MKLKINKATDLNSISVFPPQSRRLNMQTGPQSSQLRSQQSQQSFSQGISSQHGMFSQLSQTSLDEAVTNDQRFNPQERDNYVKKKSCFPQINYAHEESQMPIIRSSTNLIRKWNPTPVADNKCNDELEHRIGMIETSLNKYGMILNSVQSDVMQANKGSKEITLEMEGIGQKLTVLNSSLQQLIKGQEDTKLSLEGRLKSISDQLCNETCQDKLQQIFLLLSALPEQIEASLQKLQNNLRMTLSKEMQALACRWKTCNYGSPSIMMLAAQVTGCHSTPQRKSQPVKNPVMPEKASGQPAPRPKVEMGAWNTIKAEQIALTQRASHKERKGVFSVREEKQCRVVIESDEEIDVGFSCLMNEKETGIGNHIIDEATEESERILKRARRRKRKLCNTIIID
ncbi:putative recombination initiation defects 3 [Euphorbia lathyris]|uniref:putative recombination initiation defects 3 n=1 Tax=Euphorbia lathyris TaxID=212925 RepID=UPI00331443A7